MLFLTASIGSLLVLGYMSLPKTVKILIRKGMAITAMSLAGLIVLGIAYFGVQSQIARSSVLLVAVAVFIDTRSLSRVPLL